MKLFDSLTPLLFLAVVGSCPALKANETWSLNFSGTDGFSDTLTISGTITTAPGSSPFTIVGVNLTYTQNGVPGAPGVVIDDSSTRLQTSYDSPDNLLSATSPYFDSMGLGFLLASGSGGGDFSGDDVLYYNSSTSVYCVPIADSPSFCGALTVALMTSPPSLVSYAANLNIGESYIDITNDGANGAPLQGPGFGGASGNICVNAYAFDASEELVSCCSCLVTPDQTVNLGVNANLASKTLTGVVPTSVTVKLVATLAGAGGSGTGTICNNSAASITGTAQAVSGLEAWGTTLHPTSASGNYSTTETPFTTATLSAAELASITGRCAAIIGNASGFGICNSCRSGALGGSKL
jgi:hypothetical protein